MEKFTHNPINTNNTSIFVESAEKDIAKKLYDIADRLNSIASRAKGLPEGKRLQNALQKLADEIYTEGELTDKGEYN